MLSIYETKLIYKDQKKTEKHLHLQTQRYLSPKNKFIKVKSGCLLTIIKWRQMQTINQALNIVKRAYLVWCICMHTLSTCVCVCTVCTVCINVRGQCDCVCTGVNAFY